MQSVQMSQLLEDGVRLSGCYDSSRHPRSAICLDQTRTELWMIAVDGRRSAASGMTCDEMRDLALDLGCWDAAMLDGGGSTNPVVEGDVKNVPSDGSPRLMPITSGYFGDSIPNAKCPVGNGVRETPWHTCSGGRFMGAGVVPFWCNV